LAVQRGHAAYETADLFRSQLGPPGFDVNLEAIGQRDPAPHLDSAGRQPLGWRLFGRATDQFAHPFEAQAGIAPSANFHELIEMPWQVMGAAFLSSRAFKQSLADVEPYGPGRHPGQRREFFDGESFGSGVRFHGFERVIDAAVLDTYNRQ